VKLGRGKALEDLFDSGNSELVQFQRRTAADPAADTGGAAESRIMNHYQGAIGRTADIELKRRGKSQCFERLQSCRESGERVLTGATRARPGPAEPAVTDDRDLHFSSLRELAHSFGRRAQDIIREIHQGAALILVVDDERDVRNLVRILAERAGYRVTEASNAEDALRMIEERLLEPQLLLTDIVMPGLNGLTLAARAHHIRPSLPVMFMTGFAD
jgi:hypothetical protein